MAHGILSVIFPLNLWKGPQSSNSNSRIITAIKVEKLKLSLACSGVIVLRELLRFLSSLAIEMPWFI